MSARRSDQTPQTALSSVRRHGRSLAVVILLVALAHIALTYFLASEMLALSPGQDGIARMAATYVTEVKLSQAPIPPARPVARPSPVAPRAPSKAKLPPPKAASAPEEPASAASAPAEAASTVVVAVEPTPPPSAPELAPPPLSSPKEDPAVPAASTPRTGPTFEWPKATRVTYKLEGYFRGPIYGQAAVEWVRQGSIYQVHVDASVGPSFAPLGSWRLTSEGEIVPEGLSPRRYENVNRLLIKTSAPLVVHFEDLEVVLPSGQRVPRIPGMQDPASQFIQLAYRFLMSPDLLRVGNTIDMPLVMIKRVEMLAFDVIGEEVLHTPIGDVPTFHVKPRRVATDSGTQSAEIWFAPGLQYLPVRILTRVDDKTFMDMQMDRAPQQAPADKPAP